MQTAAHHIGQHLAQQRAAWVVVHVSYHGFTMAIIEADGVIIILIK